MTRVVVTGAAGFVGRALCDHLSRAGVRVTAAVREAPGTALSAEEVVLVRDLATYGEWPALLQGADCVVHLAARTHRLREGSRDALAAYRRDNVDVTRRLAHAARAHGVRRFVFLSSVKAMGEERDSPYTERDVPEPVTPYGISKLEAERTIQGLADLEVVVVRPPLVYGPGGKGNVPRLARLARLGASVPLPLGSVRNRRSVLFVRNLSDLLGTLIDHPRAAGGVFLASDDTAPSTPELLRLIASAQGRAFKDFAFPVDLVRRSLRSLGFENEAARLLGTLEVDPSFARERLAWSPPFSLQQGIRMTFGAA